MFPLVKTLPSYIKYTKHALQIFDQICFSGSYRFIFTKDVKSLYTVIPQLDGLEALTFFHNKHHPFEIVHHYINLLCRASAHPQQLFI